MMTDLTFYHSPRCPYANRTHIVLEQLGIPYDPVEVDLDAVPQDFRSVSPYGLVPAITYRGEHLSESNIVNEFLDETFAGGLMPEDPMGRGHVRVLMAYADDQWMDAVRALQGAGAKGRPGMRDAQGLVLKRLREIERRFKGSGPYLTGPALSLADVAFAPTIVSLPRHGMHVPHALIRTRRWAETLARLPAVQRVLHNDPAEAEEPADDAADAVAYRSPRRP